MSAKEILLLIIGISSGGIVAGGLFSFIVSLGVVSDFADRTHTGDKLFLYEISVGLGGTIGNIIYIYKIPIPFGILLGPLFGVFAGIFTGAWSMAIAEVLNIFPITIRRLKILKAIPYLIIGTALGKGVGAFILYWNNW